jgi:lactadherin
MSTGELPDTQISASSNYPPEWDRGCHARYGRVYQPNGFGWCAKFKSSSEWLQVDLGVAAKVTGLITQGRGDGLEWVTYFAVSHSVDAYSYQYVKDQYDNQRVFDGNTDSYTIKHSYLDEAIITRYVKIHTLQWHRHPSMRVEIIGCQVCKEILGLPPYGKLTSSSQKVHKRSSCQADDGYIITNKAWCSKKDNGDQWLQYDIGPPTLITGLVTKGRGDGGKKHWVTKFTITYSNKSNQWDTYKEDGHVAKLFDGNTNKEDVRYHFLKNPFVARFVRFHPVNWNYHISMRAGILGCPHSGECTNGFMRVNAYAPCVENIAFHKETFINNRRQMKRHVQNQWAHGHAGRAVDGNPANNIQSCTVLDNFYVESPMWKVDLGKTSFISGVVIFTWIRQKDEAKYQDYMHNLDKLTVYVDGKNSKDLIEQEKNKCGHLTRFNDALFKYKLHVPCVAPMRGRFVYIKASGVSNRYSRLFGAVLCEVMIYS